MTTEKMCKRWVAMYNDPKTQRTDDTCLIDTSIKPRYRQSGIEDEEREFYDRPFVKLGGTIITIIL